MKIVHVKMIAIFIKVRSAQMFKWLEDEVMRVLVANSLLNAYIVCCIITTSICVIYFGHKAIKLIKEKRRNDT